LGFGDRPIAIPTALSHLSSYQHRQLIEKRDPSIAARLELGVPNHLVQEIFFPPFSGPQALLTGAREGKRARGKRELTIRRRTPNSSKIKTRCGLSTGVCSLTVVFSMPWIRI
jgi:hypothetical protein